MNFLIKLLGGWTEEEWEFAHNQYARRLETEYNRENNFRERLKKAITLGVEVSSKYKDLEKAKEFKTLTDW